jgi:hypothetical protein
VLNNEKGKTENRGRQIDFIGPKNINFLEKYGPLKKWLSFYYLCLIENKVRQL